MYAFKSGLMGSEEPDTSFFGSSLFSVLHPYEPTRDRSPNSGVHVTFELNHLKFRGPSIFDVYRVKTRPIQLTTYYYF